MATPNKAQLQGEATALGLPTNGTNAQLKERITSFEYDAIVDKKRRRAPATKVKHEGIVLNDKKRSKLLATAQDQVRNHSLVAWMVRKHLDYVSSFHFNFRTPDTDLNKLVNRIFDWHSVAKNIDISQRLGRDEIFRMFEMEKTVSGDAAFIKIADEMKLQCIESDLIARPKTFDEDATQETKDKAGAVGDSGMIRGSQGQPLEYSICNRGPEGKTKEFDHFEPAENVIFDAYFTRFSSQFRGISPLSTAINTVQDLGESFEANILKAKLTALFGIAIMRKSGSPDLGGAAGTLEETADATATATDTHLDINLDTINVIDLDEDEKIEVIESGTPSTEFINATYVYIHLVLLALDIPVTYFDSRRSSFSARIADSNDYEKASEWKREKNRVARKEYSDFVCQTLWNDATDEWGLKAATEAAGLTLRDLKDECEWIPSGSPWLDKLKQIKGDEKAIELRVDNAIDAARRRGSNVFRNIDKQLEVEKYEVDKRLDMGLPERVAGDPAKYDIDVITDDPEDPKPKED
jgi:capsid protein|tara:strand:- start:148 stop:1719 length:1572 start_codon:yes stop_codon:yes gene_type:complete